MLGRWMRGSLLAIAVTLGAIGSTPALATSIAPLDVDQLTDASTYVVEGKVLEVWTELDPVRAVVWTRARVQIKDTMKGPDAPSEIVVDSLGGRYGDFDVYVAGQAVFSADEDVLLFLDQMEDGRLVPVAKFLGKYTIRRAPGERESYARTWHTSPNDTFDARFLPHPAPEDRVYLADLEARIQDRLEVGWDGRPIPGISNERLRLVNAPERRHPAAIAPAADRSTP